MAWLSGCFSKLTDRHPITGMCFLCGQPTPMAVLPYQLAVMVYELPSVTNNIAS